MKSLMCFIFVVSGVMRSCAFGPLYTGELPTVTFKKPNPPFDSEVVKPELFSVNAETSVTIHMSQAIQAIDVTVDYCGEGVVWQYYSSLEDQIVANCDDLQLCPKFNFRMLSLKKKDELRQENNYSPFFNGIGYTDKAVVFCGKVDPNVVQQFYKELTNADNIEVRKMNSREAEGVQKSLAARAEFLGKNITYVTTQKIFSLPLNEYFMFDGPKKYQIRIGYCIYPETSVENFEAPLNKRYIIWSKPISIEVRE